MVYYAFPLAVPNLQMQIIELSFEGKLELVPNCNDVIDGEVRQQLFILWNILIPDVQPCGDLDDVTVDKGTMWAQIIVSIFIESEPFMFFCCHSTS